MGEKCRRCIETLIATLHDLAFSIREWERGNRDKALRMQGDVIVEIEELVNNKCITPDYGEPLKKMIENEHLNARVNPAISISVFDGLWEAGVYDLSEACQREKEIGD